MKSELRRLSKSFFYALQGVWHCICWERNFRIHLTATFYALLLAVWMGLDASEWALLLLTIALVLAMELLNTAIEAVVNRHSPQRTSWGKIAKDTAAGAVLCCAVASLGVAVALFWRPERLKALWEFLRADRLALLLLLATLMLALGFIFGPENKKERK